MGAVAAAASAIQPLPILDIALLAPIHVVMVQKIGRLHGYDLDGKAVIEILSTFGAGLAAQGILLSAAKLIPFLGWTIAVPITYALTYSIGEVSEHYFVNGRGVSRRDMKSSFRKVYRERKREKAADMKRGSRLKDKLDSLVEAYEAGLIDEEEFRVAKQALLRDL